MNMREKLKNVMEKNEQQQRIIVSQEEAIEQHQTTIREQIAKISRLTADDISNTDLIKRLRQDIHDAGVSIADINALFTDTAPYMKAIDRVRCIINQRKELMVTIRSMLVTLHGPEEADKRLAYSLWGEKNAETTA